MKKHLLISALALGLIAAPATLVHADSEGSTLSQLELIDNNGPTVPVDPTDPTKPQDPNDPDNPGTGNLGKLTLDVAPATFDFGQVAIYASAKTYQAKTTGTGHQYIQVTDNRDVDEQGWQVTVEQNHDLTEATGATPHVLTGSTIAIPAGTPRNSLANDPTIADTNLLTHAAEVNEENGAVTVFETTATTNSGKGTSVKNWNPEEVSLTIPKNTAKKGIYQNTLKWTLTAGTQS
ncbi:WxL domain-containing protein [Levilactobacillus brevis]|uniref:WxL domain-containing protein n=1 Tax=Levilactobacillus brevis TaxID=1580 RepID=UPI001BA77780|nr:WxL domain-containing protein [Levilactobacillus brevis]MBS1006346.1 WxL domain-containing protein [Levilactobacillus brevis]MBS1012729.1 WxL domain-containing protein [Levilactobacillus brevis]